MKHFILTLGLVAITAIGWGQGSLIYWNTFDDENSYELSNFNVLWPNQDAPHDGHRRTINGTKAVGVAVNANMLEAYVELNTEEFTCDSMYISIKAKGSLYDDLELQYLTDTAWVTIPFYFEDNSLDYYASYPLYSYNIYYHSVDLITSKFVCGSTSFRIIDHTTNTTTKGSVDDFKIYGIANCQYDSNQDGNIGAQDLLAFLEVYGTFVDCD